MQPLSHIMAWAERRGLEPQRTTFFKDGVERLMGRGVCLQAVILDAADRLSQVDLVRVTRHRADGPYLEATLLLSTLHVFTLFHGDNSTAIHGLTACLHCVPNLLENHLLHLFVGHRTTFEALHLRGGHEKEAAFLQWLKEGW